MIAFDLREGAVEFIAFWIISPSLMINTWVVSGSPETPVLELFWIFTQACYIRELLRDSADLLAFFSNFEVLSEFYWLLIDFKRSESSFAFFAYNISSDNFAVRLYSLKLLLF